MGPAPHGSTAGRLWAGTLSGLFVGCVTLHKFPNLSEPPGPHRKAGVETPTRQGSGRGSGEVDRQLPAWSGHRARRSEGWASIAPSHWLPENQGLLPGPRPVPTPEPLGPSRSPASSPPPLSAGKEHGAVPGAQDKREVWFGFPQSKTALSRAKLGSNSGEQTAGLAPPQRGWLPGPQGRPRALSAPSATLPWPSQTCFHL